MGTIIFFFFCGGGRDDAHAKGRLRRKESKSQLRPVAGSLARWTSLSKTVLSLKRAELPYTQAGIEGLYVYIRRNLYTYVTLLYWISMYLGNHILEPDL